MTIKTDKQQTQENAKRQPKINSMGKFYDERLDIQQIGKNNLGLRRHNMTRKGEQQIEETTKDSGESVELPEFPESLKNIGNLASEAASGEVEEAMDQIHGATTGGDCLSCGAKIFRSFKNRDGEELDKNGLYDLLSCFLEYEKCYINERSALWQIIEEIAPKAKAMGQEKFFCREDKWKLAMEEVLSIKKENAALRAELSKLTGTNNSTSYQEFIANPQNKKEFDELVRSMGLQECPQDQRQAVVNIIIQRRK